MMRALSEDERSQSLGDIADIHSAYKPDAPAISDESRSVTWSELATRVHQIASALAARGVKEGDLVTIGLPNSVDFLEAALGVWKLGATPQPVSWRMPRVELEAVLNLAAPSAVIARQDLETIRDKVDVATLISEAQPGVRQPSAIAPVWKAPTSGGSTGRPKLILAGQPGRISSAPMVIWRTLADDVGLMPGPLYHNGPFVSAASLLAVGAHLVVMRKFDAAETLAAIERCKATWIYTVPTMMNRIWGLGEEARNAHDLSSLRTLWHLAAPCPPWLKKAFIDWLGGEVIWELYAGTEAQAVTVINGAEWLAKPGSVGRVVAGEMQVFDEAGNPLAPGEIGEIYMRAPKEGPATYSYLGASARTLEGPLSDWESLGDIGSIDADGFVFLADRRTDMILVGGANVYPAEIEGALEEFDGVHSAAVIGLPDDDLGSRIHAILHADDRVDPKALEAHVATRLLPYKRPRTYEFTAEPLRDDAGKVRRSQLRAERLTAR